MDRNLNLSDGSHRIACAYYFDIQEVSVGIMKIDYPVDYSIEWFLANGFSLEEVYKIINKANQIYKNCVEGQINIIIWPPAIDYVNEIVQYLKLYGEINNIAKYSYSKALLPYIVSLVYAVDDVEQWQIEKKFKSS